MYKVYYAQRYRVKKYGGLSNRMNKLMNKLAIKERYKLDNRIKTSFFYDVVRDSTKHSFTRVNTLFKACKQVNV